MGYITEVKKLNPSHLFKFDGNSTDDVGSADGTDTSVIYTDTAIAEDATYCMTTDAIEDRVKLPNTTDINDSNQTRKTVFGWFTTTATQNPPKRIYGEGGATTAVQIVMGWGNNVLFEVDTDDFNIQIYGDTHLVPNRAYHFCLVFEGSGYGNELRAYIDGVKQLNALPVDREPDYATIPSRVEGIFGDPDGNVAVGGTEVLLNASVNGKYNHWGIMDGADAVLTDSEIRTVLFEQGAIPAITISSDTASNMQTAVDAYADTLRGNSPLCMRVEDVTGSGDLSLELDNITFDTLASIHIQWLGTGTLTIVNTNGSDASIGSTPNGGTIVFATTQTLTVTCLDAVTKNPIEGARVYIEAGDWGDITAGTAIMNKLTNSSGVATQTFNYTNDQPIIGRARRTTNTPRYKTATLPTSLTSDALNATILMVKDE